MNSVYWYLYQTCLWDILAMLRMYSFTTDEDILIHAFMFTDSKERNSHSAVGLHWGCLGNTFRGGKQLTITTKTINLLL
jgi:hypothetical protein